MSNITFALDDALLQQAQAASAVMNTSVDAVVRNLLAGFVASVRAPGGRSLRKSVRLPRR